MPSSGRDMSAAKGYRMRRLFSVVLSVAVCYAVTGWASGPAAATADDRPAIRNGVVGSGSAGPVDAPGGSVRPGAHRAGVHITLSFDTGDAPCLFSRTEPLRDEFARYGVRFRGSTDRRGGAILDQCGGFDIQARSGRQFLAFNQDSYAKPPERLVFDELQRSAVMYVGTGNLGGASGRYRLAARRDGFTVATTVVRTVDRGWHQLAVSTRRGFDTLRLDATTDSNAFVVDDLTFTPKG